MVYFDWFATSGRWLASLGASVHRSTVQPKRSSRRRRSNGRTLAIEFVEPRRMMAGVMMSEQEQLVLELVNRARMNPVGEAARYAIDLNAGLAANTISATPKQPLAPNQFLINAAGSHSQDMLNRDYFNHIDPSGIGPSQRISSAGYVGRGSGENIAWSGSTGAIDVTQTAIANYESLFRSPSHRTNILRDSFDELGNGVRTGVFTLSGINYNSGMITQNFGISSNLVFVTGVAFNDSVQRDGFYTIGESLGGITVTATGSTGNQIQTQTGPSGGYSLALAPDTYTITFSGGSLAQPIAYPSVVVQTDNRKVDLNTSSIATLQLTLTSSTISEGGGGLLATLTRVGATDAGLFVLLSSSDATEATVPSSIIIPAGASSVSFTISAVDDSDVDGSQSVSVIATATGVSIATATLTVLDNDFVSLGLQLPVLSISENGGQTIGTVSRNGATSAPLVVTLRSSNPSAATVDASVTIPAGATSADFTLRAVDDPILDGPQRPLITAFAAGTQSASASITVLDNEVGSLWTNPSHPMDVSNDGLVTAIDALLLINRLNVGESGPLKIPPSPLTEFDDVSGDGFLSAIDALLVINQLNIEAAKQAIP